MNASERGSTNMTSVFTCARAAIMALALMGATSAKAADMPVKIDNFTFTPDTVEVAVGTTVVWTNGDDIPHTVVDADHKYKSSALDTGDTFSHTYTAPGTYEYFCSLHPHMTGKIIVK
jgi:plastocyanin